MSNKVIDMVMRRAEHAKSDSDFAYFFDLLLAAEALAKYVTLGMLSALSDDKERNRYRIAYALVRADGLGDWVRGLEDILTGPASQYLVADACLEQEKLTKLCRSGDWQYESICALRSALSRLSIEAEDVPAKSDMKRWFRLFATLRNKTRGHGATRPTLATEPAIELEKSIRYFYENFSLFCRSSAVLRRNLSGKYRVSMIAGDPSPFDFLKKDANHVLEDENGTYIFWDRPRKIPLFVGSPELDDFYFANGGYAQKKYELLSYATDRKQQGDADAYSIPPGTLPDSETQGQGELVPRGNCLTNAPSQPSDYVLRSGLESDLRDLLLDDKRPIITLRGKGGIGKTSLALKVLEDVYKTKRYMTVIWLSARDVDLQLSGPKPVRPNIISPEDMGILYSSLVLSKEEISKKDFKPKDFFEKQLCYSDSGPCLFVLDNFETTQNPLEMFNWLDTYIRLPNKILITTRLRDFKGDYPVDVAGMTDMEAAELVRQVAERLGVLNILTHEYINDLIRQSEGHPYVIKILLGEVAKTKQLGSIRHLIASTEEILTALFERTYSALSPCAQRAFLTLSAWMSSVPRLALEAVLFRSTQERYEVENGIDMLLQYSLAESHKASTDGQEFISLPLVAAIFGERKLNISPYKGSIQADVDLLRMLGPSRRDDIHLGLEKKLKTFVASIARRVDLGQSFGEFEPILEMICRNYPPGSLVLAQWYIELETADGFGKAKSALMRFLESDPTGPLAADVWRKLARTYCRLGDTLGEIHAYVERAKFQAVPFYDVSNTANRLNQVLREQGSRIQQDEKRALAGQLLVVMHDRRDEADADDFSRMAWLALHLGQESKAHDYVRTGLQLDPDNSHCQQLATRLGFPMAAN